MTDGYQPIFLSLVDAAKNCSDDGAVAIITPRSGVQLAGTVIRPWMGANVVTVQTKQGWCTAVIKEIAAVGSEPKPGRVPRNRPDLGDVA